MDHVLIVNWNEVVHPDDHVWVVGDFCADRAGLADAYLDQLNGSKSLVIGDRDTVNVRRAQGWEYVDWFTRILLDDQWADLSHFPLHRRPSEADGALSLFAHSHGALRGKRWSCDVGLDRWDYRPTSLAEISRRLATLAPLGFDPQSGSSPLGD
jgi:calcineurin-like phosphoesterase family protein